MLSAVFLSLSLRELACLALACRAHSAIVRAFVLRERADLSRGLEAIPVPFFCEMRCA